MTKSLIDKKEILKKKRKKRKENKFSKSWTTLQCRYNTFDLNYNCIYSKKAYPISTLLVGETSQRIN